MQNLTGKVAVVTGGASGIGHAMATRFAAEGMKLVLVDVEAGPLAEAAKPFEASGVEVLTQQIDVSDPAKMDALAQSTLDRFGSVHVVCNNAGIYVGGGALEIAESDWRWTLDVNLMGVVNGCQVFAPLLVQQGVQLCRVAQRDAAERGNGKKNKIMRGPTMC